MKMVKSLILGSAAGILAMGGAQAADLPVKAKAVEYVRICSLYGAGFFYIPGTDTCIKIGGYLRADVTVNGAAIYNDPSWGGGPGAGAAENNRSRPSLAARSREDLNIDTRTATEYGVVRTFFDATFNWTGGGGDAIAGSDVGVYYAFVQFAGFTIGKAISQFDTPWTGYPGNQSSFLIGSADDVTGINQIAYTAQFGNGVSASVSMEDPSLYDQTQIVNTTVMGASGTAGQVGILGGLPTAVAAIANGSPFSNGYGGFYMPDFVGQVRVDQAWGLFQASVAVHDVRGMYYGTFETTGHPSDAYGVAVQLALSIKNIPTGPGDTLNVTGSWADGASRYVIGGVSPNGYSLLQSGPTSGGTLAFATSTDGVFGAGGSTQLTQAFGVQGAFTHNWDPHWATAIFGSWAGERYNATATGLYCAGIAGAFGAGFGLTTCNPNFNLFQVGSYTSWTPVKNLTFSVEAMYSQIDQKMAGTLTSGAALGLIPAGSTYTMGNIGTVSGLFRVQRVF
jgi:hypothetical protein